MGRVKGDSLALCVGGVSVGLQGLDRHLTEELTGRYRAYLAEDAPEVIIDVVFSTTGRLRTWPKAAATVERIRGAHDTLRLSRQGEPFDAFVDRAAGRVTAIVPYDPVRVDLLVSTVYSVLLAYRSCVLLYGVAVRIGDAVAVVVGDCVAGGTTLADLGRNDVIADGLAVLCPSADGFIVHGTPFLGEVGHAPYVMRQVSAGSAPLGALLLSRRDEVTEIRPPRTGSSLLEVLGYTHFFGPEEFSPDIYGLVESALLSRLAGQLHWSPSADLEPLLRDAVAAHASSNVMREHSATPSSSTVNAFPPGGHPPLLGGHQMSTTS